MAGSDLLWVTDRELRVTTVSARLRDLLAPTATARLLHVSELWRSDDAFGIAGLAHQWALEGERVEFETLRNGAPLGLIIEPLYGSDGEIAGTAGRAIPKERAKEVDLSGDGGEVERICGFGSWHTDIRSERAVWSPGLYHIFGLDVWSQSGDLRAYDHPDDAPQIAQAIREGEITGTGYRIDHRIVRTDGEIRHVEEQAHTLYDSEGYARAQIGSIFDITDRKIAEARLTELAHFDPVSKLPNRRLLEQRLQASITKAALLKKSCAVFFLDVDDFKRVNDTYGHAAGDELLETIGTRLSRHVRCSDTVARMSGDEFVIVLDALDPADDVAELARKVLLSFDEPFSICGRECRVGVSIGVSTYPQCAASPDSLIEIADLEMYAVKRNGGRGIKVAQGQESSRCTGENSAWATFSADGFPSHIQANG